MKKRIGQGKTNTIWSCIGNLVEIFLVWIILLKFTWLIILSIQTISDKIFNYARF